ncbi:F-box domain-containing protein [Hirschfeldia incana]|nr:F-box domain-containing protein [Hirschfeldia incana]
MDIISGLSDDLLVKILSFVPTKVAVSTSTLSKRWKYLWQWVPTLEYDDFQDITDIYFSTPSFPRYRVTVHKNLLSHRSPTIEALRLKFCLGSLHPEDIKQWVTIALSRSVRVLSITTCFSDYEPYSALLPSSLYTCETLVSLKLEGDKILVEAASCRLPSLKTLQLLYVTYSSEDSLRLLLSSCPVLENLVIKRDTTEDNVKVLAVDVVPSLQRLSLRIGFECSSDGCVIDTPSLKYLRVEDYRESPSYLIKHVPRLEEADIIVKKDLGEFLESVTSVKRLSLLVLLFNNEEESMYCSCIVFNQLQRLKLSIYSGDWSGLLFRLLSDSPKLRVLNLDCSQYDEYEYYGRISREDEGSVVPNCLLETLETFEFTGCKGRPQERKFLSFFFKSARCLKSTSILR